MKTQITGTSPAGYGHQKITIIYTNGKNYSAVTNDMRAFDSYNSETFTRKDEHEQKQAEKSLIRFVKSQNNLK